MDVARSSDMIALLAKKHSKDIFVPECKNGPSTYGSHFRMDAWVMPRSWTQNVIRAYEVKVSRADFMGDDKWQNYLGLCHEFYFVCPNGLIQPAELPPEVGLLWSTKNGKRLLTKKKAQRRTVSIPEQLYQYILMARCEIKVDRTSGTRSERIAGWRKWLDEKRTARRVGHDVSDHIRTLLREQESTNSKLNRRVEGLQDCAAVLEQLGIDPSTYSPDDELRDRLSPARQGLKKSEVADLKIAVRKIQMVIDQQKEVK